MNTTNAPDLGGMESTNKKLKKSTGTWSENVKQTWRDYVKNRYLFLMLFPVLIWYAIFAYGPMYGVQLAFKDFYVKDGIWGSPWVGLKHFEYLFTASPQFPQIMKNTIIISFYHIIFGFPAPIILALLFNEIRFSFFKKVAQTISYLPHFLSWIVISGILITLLSPSTGVVNYILEIFGIDPIYFLGTEKYFRLTLITSAIWKEVGWGTIIFLAALAGVDSQMYEAAVIDGANRWKQTIYITLPALMPVIAILLILRVGGVLDAGFDQIFNLYSPAVYGVADILDTYVYRIGLQEFQFSLTTAVGLFKNVIGLMLVLTANYIIKKMGQEGLY
ncbi:ABC transporter permease [Paenibacillus tarimensis]